MFNKLSAKFGDLSFRWKAIIFIASVEGLFNIMFAVIVVNVMQNNLEEQFFKRAETTANIFARTTTNAVLSTDVASLESFIDEVMTNPDLLYARVSDNSDVLAARENRLGLLAREFNADYSVSAATDNIFDIFALIEEDGEVFGRVEIGLSTDLLGSTMIQIQLKVIAIGLGEIIFSAFVSFLLGTFLVRRLTDLQHASQQISSGNFDTRVIEEGSDELAQTARAFNNMAGKVSSLIEGLKQANVGLDEKRLAMEGDLQAAQAQLIQASKIKALGSLSSGIAHEINTPTQYITDNLHFLESCDVTVRKVLVRSLILLNECEKKGCFPDETEQIRKVCDEENLDFILDELPLAISQSLDGTKRVSEIVSALKEFSHPNQKEKTPVDVNRIVANAVTISRSEWRHDVDVTSDFETDLPKIMCVPSEITQVLINLIINAFHAIKDGPSAQRGCIDLRTRLLGSLVEIQISDNGVGINEKIKNNIFDPFFSTKEVGRGTGQGLSISHDIVVNKHSGEIVFETVEGSGTTFFVRLPILP